MFNTNSSGILEIPSSSGGSITTQNVVYVSKNGNDSTGLRNRLDRPFLTIQAAINAAVAGNLTNNGDLIYIYPGVYTETVINSKDRTFMYFSQGAIITTGTSTPTLRLTGSNIKVYGYPEIYGTSNQPYSLSIENNTIIFDCEQIRQDVFNYPNIFCNINAGCASRIYSKEMFLFSNSGFDIKSNNNSFLELNIDNIESTSRIVNLVGNGSCYLYFTKIFGGREAILCNSGTGNIYVEGGYANLDYSGVNRPIVRCDGGTHTVSLKDTVTNKYSIRGNPSGTTVVKVLGNVQEKLDSTSINPIIQQVGTIQVSADIPDL